MEPLLGLCVLWALPETLPNALQTFSVLLTAVAGGVSVQMDAMWGGYQGRVHQATSSRHEKFIRRVGRITATQAVP